MSDYSAHAQERTARKLLTQSPGLFVGSADGVAVYWDSVERAFAVIPTDGNAEKVKLAETPYDTPAEYCDHIQRTRGWDVGPRIGGSLLGDLQQDLEAAR